MSKLLKFLNHGLKHYPLPTNALVYGSMFVGAECLNQTLSRRLLIENPLPYDVSSIKRLAVFGTFGQGPMLTIWYRWLDGNFPGRNRSTIVKKLLLDQFAFTPVLYAVFYIATSFMEKKDDLFEELIVKFPKTFVVSCFFWFPTQTVNFSFVPPIYRVLYMGCAAFVWVTILCYIKSEKSEK